MVVRDEESMLPGCLSRIREFADEAVILVDNRSVDGTIAIAQAAGARVVKSEFQTFAQFRNESLELARSDWIVVVDADERVSSALAQEIRGVVDRSTAESAYTFPVRNYFYGRVMNWGGWDTERPVRLFRKGSAVYVGDLHEHLSFADAVEIQNLTGPLYHFSHRSVLENLQKTSLYAGIEAAQSRTKRATAGSLMRACFRELLRRLVVHRGYRDGTAGVVESFYQAFSVFCVEARIWELQRTPSIAECYERLDRELP